MDEATPLTPFDTMTQTREIQMLKTVIPYMKSSQKKQFAILIKYMELQNTLHIFLYYLYLKAILPFDKS